MNRSILQRLMVAGLTVCMITAMASCSGSGAKIPDEYNYGDLSQYIKLAEYKGVEYTKITGDVSDEEIKEYVDSMLLGTEESIEIKEGVVKEDSIVNIDYVGSIDGVEFEGGTAQGQELDIANSTYIPGFAEGIVGHEVGETFDLHVTFPENYGNEELNGKAAVFKTTINALIEKKEPKYNDEWVAKNSEYKTTEEYDNYVKETLSAENLASADANQKSEVFSKILEGSEVVEYPEKELASRVEMVKKYYEDYAANAGVGVDELLAQFGMDTTSFEDMAKEQAQASVKQELVLHAIKDAEGLKPKQSDYNEYLAQMLEEAGMTADSFKEQYGQTIEEYADANGMFTTFLYKIVMDKVMEYAVGK